MRRAWPRRYSVGVVYLVWLEVSPMASCKIPSASDPRLECAVPADTPEQVEPLIRSTLRRHRFELLRIEACIAYGSADWSDRADPDGVVAANELQTTPPAPTAAAPAAEVAHAR